MIPGQGIAGTIDKARCLAGNRKLMETNRIDISVAAGLQEKLADEGKTPLYFAQGGKFLGVIAAADVVKPTSREAIARLQEMGMDVIMLTGDNARTAEAIKKQVGIKTVIADVLPQDKEFVGCRSRGTRLRWWETVSTTRRHWRERMSELRSAQEQMWRSNQRISY